MAYSYSHRDQTFDHSRDVSSVTSSSHEHFEANSGHPYLSYPPHNQSNPSFYKSQATLNATKNDDVTIHVSACRTPSPTPSEQAMLNRKGFIDWKKMMSWRFWVRREWLWYYIILGILLILVILISVYDRQIVRWLQPTGEKIRDLPGGWLIPIAIFFVISFPPLFGHEILAILCGVVWGLGIGFAITAAGTFVGEMGNFYAFKYCCRARGEKLEKKDLQYACLARLVRDGGFKIALVARYSAIPGHFTTAVFSTCGMGILVFALAAALSLPKQLVTVYIGVILKESGTGTESTRDKIISDSVLAITMIITGLAMWYMYKKMDEIKHDVIYKRRKARQAKLERAHSIGGGSSVFNPLESESDLPLNPGEDAAYQQWNSQGQATGYVGDPSLNKVHAPAPRRATPADVHRVPTFRTENGGGYTTSGERYASPGHLDPSSTSSPQAVSPVRSPAFQREESTDSVGWDTAGQRPTAEAYHLPTIHPHTPLSGDFAKVPMSANNPFNKSQLQQVQQSDSRATPLPPPLAPPPSSPQRNSNPYSPTSPSQRTVYPTAGISDGYVSPQQTIPPASTPYGPSVPVQQYPANMYSSPQPAPQSPMQTPMQYGFTSPPQPQSFSPAPYTHPQSPVFAPGQAATGYVASSGAPNPHSPGFSQVGNAIHAQESSDASMYFTPTHSQAATESQFADRLPTPTLPPGYHP